MKCVYQFNEEIPESRVISFSEGELIRIFFDISPLEKKEDPDGDFALPEAENMYSCEQVDVVGRTYSEIVSAIINDKYSPDQVQAILSNYIDVISVSPFSLEEKREEYLKEYNNFQEWRNNAKNIANIVLSNINQ